MKRIMISTLSMAMIASANIAMAGGPEKFVAEVPPPVEDFFSGFSIGVVGSFWDNHFDANSSAAIVCDNLTPLMPGGGTCLSPFSGIIPPPLLPPIVDGSSSRGSSHNHNTPDLIIFFNNNGNGTDLSGGAGIQASLGKVFFTNGPLGYYVGAYGGAIWGNSSDTISSSLNLLVDSDVVLPRGITIEDGLAHSSVVTEVEMENIYDIGLQLGVLLAPRTMAYLKAGAAFSELEVNTAFNLDVTVKFPAIFNLPNDGVVVFDGVAQANASDNELGFEVGVGVTQALTENISFSLEYMYRGFGDINAGPGEIFVPADLVKADLLNPLFFQVKQASTDLTESSVQASLAWRFHWLG